MFRPGEAFNDCNPRVIACVYHFTGMAMETVLGVYGISASMGDSYDIALSWVEAHLPCLFSLFQFPEFFLKELSIIVVFDHHDKCGVVSEKHG